MFPSQVADSTSQFESRLETLGTWQPKKLHFMSDASDTSFMEGHGPSYDTTTAAAPIGTVSVRVVVKPQAGGLPQD